ncbi:dipeptide ABC transporter ATP-binding protein [Paragemmobacter straminiformis]|uniref:Glutathione import ATP-binding protein GsiA n=1 Tax=Paragemmobacter straminiformis TaxID=2045119 RepID=A0A842I594_9RHOB|nr:ABC transporter ATP-binding protein [Gemmobacter straminiformis]MBC2834547.1 ABC transporter ATP-binding protein [Gemmobacter straminiformis]
MTAPLAIAGLSVAFRHNGEERRLLDDVALTLNRGEILGLVGESGSGKSLLCRTVMGLLPSAKLQVTAGSIRLDGEDILAGDRFADIRGRRIGMIFQNPTSHLDPVMRIGQQISEGLMRHKGLGAQAARAEATDLLAQVGFADPPRAFESFAHQFSGGMRQRAMIAIALACDPEILIADEPTTALDVTIQAQILRLLMDLRIERGLSMILITHDLGVVAQTCDRIAVMQGGRIVETGEKRALLAAPQHGYTRQLIASHPSVGAAGAHVAVDREGAPLIRVENLEVRFPVGGGFLRKGQALRAVKDVSLSVWAGETVGIVGESGSGKSTLARTILGLTPATSGDVLFEGASLAKDRGATLRRLRSDAAMVFQDPFNSLNPRMTIGATLAEVLKTQGETPPDRIAARIGELLDMVGLERSFAGRKPRSLSGGQCQRAGIARALAVNPRVIIADECVAALDVTIQAQIIDLFRALTATGKLTLIFIAHDLAIVRNLCERVVVMHHGEIVEDGPSTRIFARPERPYTAALIAAIPDIDPDRPLNGGTPTHIQQELAP